MERKINLYHQNKAAVTNELRCNKENITTKLVLHLVKASLESDVPISPENRKLVAEKLVGLKLLKDIATELERLTKHDLTLMIMGMMAHEWFGQRL
jgi:hypothetical protein